MKNTQTPQEIWEGLDPRDQRRVLNFHPGIWDARSVFEEYARLDDLFTLDGKVWQFTDLGHAVSEYGRMADARGNVPRETYMSQDETWAATMPKANTKAEYRREQTKA